MRHLVTVHLRGAAPEQRTVEAALTAGGSRADGIVVEGLPPAALRLAPSAAGLVVEASVPGVRVRGRPVPPGARRLLRGGEELEACGIVLALHAEPPGDDGTRCAAEALLRGAAAGEPVAAARLVVLTGPQAGERHPLGAETTIGRGRAAAIRLRDPRASRLHALLRVGPSGWTVEDLGAKNGVRVGGVRIDARRPVAVRGEEELVVGDTALAVEGSGHGGARAATPAPRRRAPPSALRLASAALLALSAAALAVAAS